MSNEFKWNDAINKIFAMTKEEREQYVSKITNEKTPADEIFEFVDEDVKSIENYVARELYKIFMQDDPAGFYKVRKQILKKQKVGYFKAYEQERLLLLNRFSLEQGEPGAVWRLQAEEEETKSRIRRAFGEDVPELNVEQESQEPILLWCRKDFTKCTVSQGEKTWEMDTESFMECVGKI